MQVELICANCFDPTHGLVAHGPVDHVIADPAYSEKVHRRHRTARKGAGGPTAKQALGFEPLTAEVRLQAAEAIAAVVRRWVIVFSDLEGAGAWCEDFANAGLEPVQVGIWDKVDATPQLRGDRPACPAEALVVAHATRRGRPMRKRWNGGGRALRYRGPSKERGIKRVHPTQKPLWLMETLLRDFTDPGEVTADPFAGVGTTLVAAKRLSRGARGWEQTENWAALGQQRIAAACPQFELPGLAVAGRARQLPLEDT
ncbi:MAG: site-specific DNA-methyltransferase [Deltaproteobacteria bacterium]|nr:site-specific DNA-methyltransferase [Deltaproteobacteria bacterium]